jgi:predicted deacetylase
MKIMQITFEKFVEVLSKIQEKGYELVLYSCYSSENEIFLKSIESVNEIELEKKYNFGNRQKEKKSLKIHGYLFNDPEFFLEENMVKIKDDESWAFFDLRKIERKLISEKDFKELCK